MSAIEQAEVVEVHRIIGQGAIFFGRGVSEKEIVETKYAEYQRAEKEINLNSLHLSGANLEGIVLVGAQLSGTEFYGANLRGANLSFAVLCNIDFTEADLTGADLTGAIVDPITLKSIFDRVLAGQCALPSSLWIVEHGASLAFAKLHNEPKGAPLDKPTLEKWFADYKEHKPKLEAAREDVKAAQEALNQISKKDPMTKALATALAKFSPSEPAPAPQS